MDECKPLPPPSPSSSAASSRVNAASDAARVSGTSPSLQGLAEIASHVIACRLSQESRVQICPDTRLRDTRLTEEARYCRETLATRLRDAVCPKAGGAPAPTATPAAGIGAGTRPRAPRAVVLPGPHQHSPGARPHASRRFVTRVSTASKLNCPGCTEADMLTNSRDISGMRRAASVNRRNGTPWANSVMPRLRRGTHQHQQRSLRDGTHLLFDSDVFFQVFTFPLPFGDFDCDGLYDGEWLVRVAPLRQFDEMPACAMGVSLLCARTKVKGRKKRPSTTQAKKTSSPHFARRVGFLGFIMYGLGFRRKHKQSCRNAGVG